MARSPNALARLDPEVANALSENPYDRLNRIWGTPMIRGLSRAGFLQENPEGGWLGNNLRSVGKNALQFVENMTTPKNMTSVVAGALMPYYPQRMSPLHQRINQRARQRELSPTARGLAEEAGIPIEKYSMTPEFSPRYGLSEEEAARIARLPRLERAEALGWGEKVRGRVQIPAKSPSFGELGQVIKRIGADPEKLTAYMRGGLGDEVELPNVWFHSTSTEPLKGVGLTRAKLGSNTGAPSAKKAFWFASEPEVSESYIRTQGQILNPAWEKLDTRLAAVKREFDDLVLSDYDNPAIYDTPRAKKLWLDIKMMEAQRDKLPRFVPTLPQGTMTKTRLKMQNPYIHDQGGQNYREETYNDLVKKAKEGGHDGLIILNTYDPGGGSGGSKLTNVAAVWNENQVRVPHAKFNPYHAGSGDLLKTVAPVALLGGSAARLIYENKKPKESVSMAPSHRARKD